MTADHEYIIQINCKIQLKQVAEITDDWSTKRLLYVLTISARRGFKSARACQSPVKGGGCFALHDKVL